MPVLIDEKNKRIYKWSGNEAFLGRTSDNAIQVKHTAVSRHHCVVTRVDGEYFIEDLGSRNGTAMNGAKLPAAEPMLLEPGDTIQFGPLKLHFDLKIPEKKKKAGLAEEVRESPEATAHEDLETVRFPAPDSEPDTDEPEAETPEEEFIEPKTEKTRVLRPRRKAEP
ncbi:MAG: FHA domain-containing protein, partial [Planctomycetota bacterium]|nr:FHA domain-containing protein [Planctomycetota bacterium]